MRSSNLPHQPRLDHIRCLAAGLVFAFHLVHLFYLHWQPAADKPWFGLISEGHTGVGLFFTLSGFLFMQIGLHHERIDYGDFIRNRFLRIFPLFVTVFVLAISISRDNFNPQDVLYLFFSNLGRAPTSNTFITGAAWTISLEFSFYLVFPFLSRFVREHGAGFLLRLLALMLLFKVGAWLVTERSTHMFYSTLVGRFDQFLIGMLAAVLFARHRARLARLGMPLLAAAVLLVVLNSALQARYASYFLPVPRQAYWIFWSMLEAGAWALLITAWQVAPVRMPARLDRLLCRGGEISFSFYLLHGMVLYIAHQVLGPVVLTGRVMVDSLLIGVPLYFLCWQVAALSYEAIEKPFLGLRRRYGERLPHTQQFQAPKDTAEVS
ncbi:acyltransferase [Cupriavidus necator]|uniref:Acyltransferase n=1 Tax=Cupriavidus necator TaxID=106590 RepID=A0A1U9UUY7_CUPNE|nr:acyltransferase [Cupriavidus necator]AQV96379.1 acyltransferase [Cupriavidus necator]